MIKRVIESPTQVSKIELPVDFRTNLSWSLWLSKSEIYFEESRFVCAAKAKARSSQRSRDKIRSQLARNYASKTVKINS